MAEIIEHDNWLTMQEAMDYLSSQGFPCRSRSTFYRIVKDFDIPYKNLNPTGKNEVRRFSAKTLERFVGIRKGEVDESGNAVATIGG